MIALDFLRGIGSIRRSAAAGLASVALAAACLPATAHFQMLYLGDSAKMPGGALEALMVFTHPFSGGPTMEMGLPQAFYVLSQRGHDAPPRKVDLLAGLKPIQWRGSSETGATAFVGIIPSAEVRSLGDYIFVLEPTPFFEESEDKYIQQFTKTIVNVGGVPGNWDKDVGLPAEIRPLDKPYANWKGGVFRGVVLSSGAPVPFAEIEVEFVNRKPDATAHGWTGEPEVEAPHPSLEGQSIRADATGTFVIGLPKAGWWGIGALDVGPVKEYQGKPLSQDAVIWVQVTDIE